MQRKSDFATLYSREYRKDFDLRDGETYEASSDEEAKAKPTKRSRVTTLTWNCFRFFLFCAFTVPCAYVVEEYYREFGTNKRVLDVVYPEREPEMIGITVCTKNLFKKSSLCKHSGELCERLQTSTHLEFDSRDIAEQMNIDLLQQLTYQNGEILKRCYIREKKRMVSTKICKVAKWVYMRGQVCFLINFQPNHTDILSHFKHPRLLMVLGIDNRQYWKPNVAAGLDLFFHSNRDISTENDARFTAYRGAKYKVTFTKASDIVNQIGDCTDYDFTQIEEPDTQFPIRKTKNTCNLRCLWRYSITKYGCVAPALTSFAKTKRCEKKDGVKYDIPSKTTDRCFRRCKDDCDRYKYEIKKELEKSMVSWNKYEVNVTVHLTPKNVTLYTHRQKVTSLDVVGYVIAAVGMFMGFAFPGIIDALQNKLQDKLNENPKWIDFWEGKESYGNDDEQEVMLQNSQTMIQAQI